MPKVGNTKSKFKLAVQNVGPYEGGDLLCGNFRFGQLILIRCKETREFLQLLRDNKIEFDLSSLEDESQPIPKPQA